MTFKTDADTELRTLQQPAPRVFEGRIYGCAVLNGILFQLFLRDSLAYA